MFGSLLALAPRGVFSAETLWATVAGANAGQTGQTKLGKRLTIFAELCTQLNDDSDSAALAVHPKP
jgi:hypothetical protein